MRSILPILTVLGLAMSLGSLSGCSRTVDPEAGRLLKDAQRTFDSAKSPDDYFVAAGLYQQVLDRGVVSGAVLYNQGNAYLHAGQRGRAIAAYRQAQHYRPRDPYLEANLACALATDPSSRRRYSLVGSVLFWRDWLSELELFRGAATAATVALVFGVARLWLRSRILGWLAVAGMVATCWFSLSAAYGWYRHEHVARGVVVSPETIARQGTARSYEPALTQPLADGAEFRLLERRGEWLHIRLQDGQEGWVERNHTVLY